MRHLIAPARGRICQNGRSITMMRCAPHLKVVATQNKSPSQRNRTSPFSHSTRGNKASPSLETNENSTADTDATKQYQRDPKYQPLSLLPLAMIIRSLATSTVSSSPKLLAISLSLLRFLAHSETKFLNPDHNSFLRYILNNVLYKQFCAGENAEQVAETLAQVKRIGFTGAILAYAKETPNDDAEDGSANSEMGLDPREKADRQISTWLENSLETVRLATAGDFVALKYVPALIFSYHVC